MAADTSEELERFRQQWQEEVQARSRAGLSIHPRTRSTADPGLAPRRAPSPQPSTVKRHGEDDRTEGSEICYSNNHVDTSDGRQLSDSSQLHLKTLPEPRSALENYEKGVERERNGSLGDSVRYYRKAYRLDAGVDQLYRQKYFPPSAPSSKPTDPNPSNATATVPNTAHHFLDDPSSPLLSELISSFQSSRISGIGPLSDASPPSLCPMALLPSELRVKILFYTALSDVASFARLAQVCRHLAYLVATEDRIWRTVCESDKVGFRAMHFTWALSIKGNPLPMSILDLDAEMSRVALQGRFNSLSLSASYPSFRAMFHRRPRLRFNGCYISTVNYTRPGAATASQATWASPVLIVTYYRYLRFFRDGSCMSLLTTAEPSDVVRYLIQENLHNHHAGGLPTAVMNQALRGRWKLKGNPYAQTTKEAVGDEGVIDIETDGVDADRPQPKYMYKMMLQMRNMNKASHATQNNKLVWLGYWSYNKLTDDWAEFGLKNDRAYIWSRVRSWS